MSFWYKNCVNLVTVSTLAGSWQGELCYFEYFQVQFYKLILAEKPTTKSVLQHVEKQNHDMCFL